MGKPKIKPFNIKEVAVPGEFIIRPGASDISFRVGSNTAFLSQAEVYTLIRTLDHYATEVWGDEWIQLFTEGT